MRTHFLTGLLGLLALSFLGAAVSQGVPSVVVSIHPYGSLVRQLVGDLAKVDVLLPAGASPHTFEPTPRAAARLASADLVIFNGGVDEWVRDLAEATGANRRILEALEVVHREGLEGEAGEHNENPHIWLDPLLASQVVLEIANELSSLRPEWRDEYQARAQELIADLESLDAELRQSLSVVAGAPFIPFHDAWPYFAHSYSLDLLLEIEPFPGREPSPRYLAQVIGVIRESGAPAIFTEVGLSRRPAEVLAGEAGVELHTLDPVGDQGESYQELLRANASTIREALLPWTSR